MDAELLERARAVMRRARVEAGIEAPAFPLHSASDVTEGDVIAVCISSKILEADIWLAFREKFNPGDGLAIFFPDELCFLQDKTAETLRVIHWTKLAYGGGRVRQ